MRARGVVPDGHVGTGDDGKLDGARETLVTHGIIVLQANLELDGLQKVTLLLIERVVKKLLDVATNSGCKSCQNSILRDCSRWWCSKTYRL